MLDIYKFYLNTYRMTYLYNHIYLGIPHVYVEDIELKTVDVLVKYGKSKNWTRKIIKQGGIKVEDIHGEKHRCGEIIDDSAFAIVEQGKVACALLWMGKKIHY